MCICTYLDEQQYTQPVTDNELNKLLAEVRARTDRDWRLHEHILYRRRWFSKPVEFKWYSLYVGTYGSEFQIINFYRPDEGEHFFSINTVNTAGHVAAYFYGMLAVLGSKHIG